MPASKFSPLSTYMDLLLDTVCVVDAEGRFVYVSAGCERVFGYTQEEMVGRSITDLLHPDDLESTLRTANEVMQGKTVPYFENRYLRKDGSIAHIMWSARWSEDDKLRIGVARDISSRVRSEAKQRATYAISEAAHSTPDLEELFRLIHRIVADLLPLDSFSITLFDNDSGSGAAADSEEKSLVVPLRTQTRVLGDLRVSRNHNQQNFSDVDQELLHFVSIQIAAAVERQQMLAHLQQLALYDSLTQLPNRSLFEDRMRSALARARRDKTALALIYIDLDRFKDVNDTYGHATGDLLLQQAARRFESCLRECDTVARLSGDEFVVLLENIVTNDHVNQVCDKIRSTLSTEFQLEPHRANITLSMGTAHYPADGKDMQSLLHHADMQMYEVKRKTRSSRRI